MSRIAVLGAGSFGTALAVHLASAGNDVVLWARRRDAATRLVERRVNEAYLPGVELPEGLEVTSDLALCASCEPILVAVPSHGFRRVVHDLLRLPESRGGSGAPTCSSRPPRGSASDAAADESGHRRGVGERGGAHPVRSPVGSQLRRGGSPVGAPSAAVVASTDPEVAAELQRRLATPAYRLYRSADVVGVEIVGAAKNVIAIGAGVVSGLGLGYNTQAALMTRGLHEIARLGVACGSRCVPSPVCGLGDLVLTCTGALSRNRRTGLELAEGRTLAEILAGTSMVAEGVRNSVALLQLARQHAVEMPIIEQMVAIMYEGKSPRRAIADLMGRQPKSEAELRSLVCPRRNRTVSPRRSVSGDDGRDGRESRSA